MLQRHVSLWGLQGIQEGNEVNDLDRWAAEQCGLVPLSNAPDFRWCNKTAIYWTLDDARCREIVREHFRFDTEIYGHDMWQCYSDIFDDFVEGKTIAEAEIACIKAIKEAMNE